MHLNATKFTVVSLLRRYKMTKNAYKKLGGIVSAGMLSFILIVLPLAQPLHGDIYDNDLSPMNAHEAPLSPEYVAWEAEELNLQQVPTIEAELLPPMVGYVDFLPATELYKSVEFLDTETQQIISDLVADFKTQQEFSDEVQQQIADLISELNTHQESPTFLGIDTPMATSSTPGYLRPDFTFNPDLNHWTAPFVVLNGHTAHLQLDLPPMAHIDYNMQVLEAVWDEVFGYLPVEVFPGFVVNVPGYWPTIVGFTLLSSSELITHIVGGRTLPELIEFRNDGTTAWPTMNAQTYLVIVACINGSSIPSQPPQFTLHVGYGVSNDPIIDQHPNQANTIVFPSTPAVFTLTGRALHSYADNNWYRITVPAGFPISAIQLELDAHSLSHNYAAELYIRHGANTLERILSAGSGHTPNAFDIVAGTTYYIRVHNAGLQNVSRTRSNANYTLTIRPIFRPTHIQLRPELENSMWWVNWHLGRLQYIRSGSSYGIPGYAFMTVGGENFTVAGMIIDNHLTNHSWPYSRSNWGITNENGRFWVAFSNIVAGGTQQWFNNNRYGVGQVHSTSGNVSSSVVRFYIVSQSMMPMTLDEQYDTDY
jgi:hypothetical protein